MIEEVQVMPMSSFLLVRVPIWLLEVGRWMRGRFVLFVLVLGLLASAATLIMFGPWLRERVVVRFRRSPSWEFLRSLTSEGRSVRTTLLPEQIDRFQRKRSRCIVIWPFSVPAKRTDVGLEPLSSPTIIHRIHARYLKHFQARGFDIIAIPFDLSMHYASKGGMSRKAASRHAMKYLQSLVEQEDLRFRRGVFLESRITRGWTYSKTLVGYLYQHVGRLSVDKLDDLVKDKHTGDNMPCWISKEISMGAIACSLAKRYRCPIITFGGEDERKLWSNLVPLVERDKIFHVFLPELCPDGIEEPVSNLVDIRALILNSELEISVPGNPMRYLLEHYFLLCAELTGCTIKDRHGSSVPSIEDVEKWGPARIRALCLDLANRNLARVCDGKKFCEAAAGRRRQTQ